jgi:hypothetical protein
MVKDVFILITFKLVLLTIDFEINLVSHFLLFVFCFQSKVNFNHYFFISFLVTFLLPWHRFISDRLQGSESFANQHGIWTKLVRGTSLQRPVSHWTEKNLRRGETDAAPKLLNARLKGLAVKDAGRLKNWNVPQEPVPSRFVEKTRFPTKESAGFQKCPTSIPLAGSFLRHQNRPTGKFNFKAKEPRQGWTFGNGYLFTRKLTTAVGLAAEHRRYLAPTARIERSDTDWKGTSDLQNLATALWLGTVVRTFKI